MTNTANRDRQPTPADFYELLNEREETRPLAGILSRFVTGSAANLGGMTNIDMNNKYIVLDISEIGKELLPFGTLLAADICSGPLPNVPCGKQGGHSR
ncbi:MAG: hypothetical protein ACLR4Z_00430 [Butyricicoccaceae bacterium]